jgi:arabinofuranan 3-O-arabinosyltransferase
MLDPNLNPPITVPLFQALARLPLWTAAYVWMGGSYLLFVLSGGMLLALNPAMQRRQAVWIALSSPVFATLALGQIYALLLLLAVLMSWALRRGQITAAGLCLGAIIALRPLFLLWPALLALRGQRRLAWQSLAGCAAYSLLPVSIYGPGIYMQWFHAIGNDQHYIFLTDIALPALGKRLGHPGAGWGLAVITGAVCAYAAWRHREIGIHRLSVICACLCAPLAWTLYLLLAYPWMLERRWNGRMGIVAMLMLIPDAVFFLLRTEACPNWVLLLGTVAAMSIPILLLLDTWIDGARELAAL